MANEYKDYQGATYHENQPQIDSSHPDDDSAQVTVQSSQIFEGTLNGNTFDPVSIADENYAPSSSDIMQADAGMAGDNTISLNSDYNGTTNTGLVEATTTGGDGGKESMLLQQTPYTTADGTGTIFYVPEQTITDTYNGQTYDEGVVGGEGEYIEATSTTYTAANDIPSSQDLVSNGNSFAPIDTACFVTGTFIRTPDGDVTVEDLKVGDMVLTSSGQIRPVRWIGNLHVTNLPSQDCARARNLWPIRIAAHAFATNVPDRDLVVSPGHAIAVTVMDEVFTQAIRLVNGATIRQEPRDSVTYWHVELDSHDVLLSNNLPSESYLDVGNRAALGLNVPALRPAASVSDYARPLVEDGPVIDAIRARLVARARGLGWQVSSRSNMHLSVDGKRVETVMNGDQACFTFPATAQNVHLRSRTFRPAEWESCSDTRTLGLSLSGLHIADGLGHEADIALDHANLENQFHEGEAADNVAWRWTRGDLHLPPELWANCKGQVTLTLTLQHANGQYWDQAGAENDDAPAGDAHMSRMRA
ncbi:outer membrane protein [Komagataeibacter oboediens]|nr:outer membrane protein [Komagataeibacter oboediens]